MVQIYIVIYQQWEGETGAVFEVNKKEKQGLDLIAKSCGVRSWIQIIPVTLTLTSWLCASRLLLCAAGESNKHKVNF